MPGYTGYYKKKRRYSYSLFGHYKRKADAQLAKYRKKRGIKGLRKNYALNLLTGQRPIYDGKYVKLANRLKVRRGIRSYLGMPNISMGTYGRYKSITELDKDTDRYRSAKYVKTGRKVLTKARNRLAYRYTQRIKNKTNAARKFQNIFRAYSQKKTYGHYRNWMNRQRYTRDRNIAANKFQNLYRGARQKMKTRTAIWYRNRDQADRKYNE